jgi:hypothetical protein
MSGYTNDFALVAEGVTDHAVLKTVLLGFFKGQLREPKFSMSQPDQDATTENEWQRFGNWENVFRYLREGHHRDALQFNQYLVVQLDTDCSERPGFDIPRHVGGERLDVPILVERVVERIRKEIGEDDCRMYGERLLFAVCVDSLECWLLPLWADQEIHQARTTGCLDALNRNLDRRDQPPVDPASKQAARYFDAARGYRKRKELLEAGRKNPSLGIFLDTLEARSITLAVDD